MFILSGPPRDEWFFDCVRTTERSKLPPASPPALLEHPQADAWKTSPTAGPVESIVEPHLAERRQDFFPLDAASRWSENEMESFGEAKA